MSFLKKFKIGCSYFGQPVAVFSNSVSFVFYKIVVFALLADYRVFSFEHILPITNDLRYLRSFDLFNRPFTAKFVAWKTLILCMIPVVNFINIFCARFLYERHFGSFFPATFGLAPKFCTKKCAKKRWWNWQLDGAFVLHFLAIYNWKREQWSNCKPLKRSFFFDKSVLMCYNNASR